jgi:hypothetical protein
MEKPMEELACDAEGVTEDDVVVRLSRFLPPGKGYARARQGDYAVAWCPDQQMNGSARRFAASSRVDFDSAFHLLIAACAQYCVAYRAQRLRTLATDETKSPVAGSAPIPWAPSAGRAASAATLGR